jgi:hypothetical protein
MSNVPQYLPLATRDVRFDLFRGLANCPAKNCKAKPPTSVVVSAPGRKPLLDESAATGCRRNGVARSGERPKMQWMRQLAAVTQLTSNKAAAAPTLSDKS